MTSFCCIYVSMIFDQFIQPLLWRSIGTIPLLGLSPLFDYPLYTKFFWKHFNLAPWQHSNHSVYFVKIVNFWPFYSASPKIIELKVYDRPPNRQTDRRIFAQYTVSVCVLLFYLLPPCSLCSQGDKTQHHNQDTSNNGD